MQPEAAWARDLARTLLEEPLPRRWAHTQGVAGRAESFASAVGSDAQLLQAAAWLHDVGYSPAIAETGFHPLDGARYLRDTEHADARLCRLVANHSCACIEAEERGLADVLNAEFPTDDDDPLTSPLIYCDMTTDPDGRHVSYDARLTEILSRYGDEDVVNKSMRRAEPSIRKAIDSAERLRTTN
jgi:hypothetical protein